MVWYQKVRQRAIDRTAATALGWKAPLNRLVLSTKAEWVKTRTRPGFEIDARAQRNEPAYAGSVEVRGLAKTFIGVRGGWREVTFDDAAVIRGRESEKRVGQDGEGRGGDDPARPHAAHQCDVQRGSV